MAYYSIYKRIKCKNWKPFDMIGWYSYQLYLEWYDSLSDEEKEYLKKKKEKRAEEFKKSWALINSFLVKYYYSHERIDYRNFL